MALPDDMITHLQDQVNSDPELMRRGKYYSTRFIVGVDEVMTLFVINDGRLTEVAEGTADAEFTIQTDGESWKSFNEDHPKPGYHDLTALIDSRHARISGNVIPWLSNMLYVKRVIDKWRVIA